MSFQQGLSGLNATARNLEVIGNNIANAGTYGAKASRAEFADMYANALGSTGSGSVGMGVRTATVAQQFSQGNLTTTDNPLDIAINGEGFFALKDSKTDAAISYTRNGQFKKDADGYIVNDQNRYLTDSTGNLIQIPTTPNTPVATASMGLTLNLDANAKVITPPAAPAAPIDFKDASTYTSSTSMTIYDQGGGERGLTYYFQKTASNTWDVYASVDGSSAANVAGTTIPDKIAQMTATSTGASITPTTVAIDTTTLNALGYNLAPTLTVDLSKATQYASQFGVTKLDVQGHGMGQFSGLSVDAKGQLLASYSNGQTQAFGQIGLTTFDNPQGLQPIGGNAWRETPTSGTASMGAPTEGIRGQLQSGALEESNVDLTAELINMMTAQRMYQANSQTIKTEDQILQTLVNLR